MEQTKKKVKKKPAKKKPAKKKPAKAEASTSSPKPAVYHASIPLGSEKVTVLPPAFGKAVSRLEDKLSKPIILLWQGRDSQPNFLSHEVFTMFMHHVNSLPHNEPVAILVQSPGGYGDVAFRLARLIQNRCGGYTVYVPRWAKSAATLFALGADEVVLGTFGELGPLDAQIHDFEREEERSALEVVQAVERLNREAMSAMDQQMLFWIRRSGKKIDTLLPVVSHFVAEMMAPMFDKIDAVDYTKNARMLKVAQDYAVRLLRDHGDLDRAERIASALTNEYSEHGFVIDVAEARRIGLRVNPAPNEIADALDGLAYNFSNITALGAFSRGTS